MKPQFSEDFSRRRDENAFDGSQITQEIWARCASIRVVVSDVDGTLTDGGMYYTASGEVMKRFSAHDGLGMQLLERSGIKVVLMTSDASGIAGARGRKLGISKVFENISNKALMFNELSDSLQVPNEQIAVIGDDINDEYLLKYCGVSACPADAIARVRAWTDYICIRRGGYGAFREFAELILAANSSQSE